MTQAAFDAQYQHAEPSSSSISRSEALGPFDGLCVIVMLLIQ
jgi:hypothetical protein